MAHTVKNLPAVQETRVQFLDQKDPLDMEMATHCSYSCLENSMDRGAWQATVRGAAESDMTERLALMPSRPIHTLTNGGVSSFCGRIAFHCVCGVYICHIYR